MKHAFRKNERKIFFPTGLYTNSQESLVGQISWRKWLKRREIAGCNPSIVVIACQRVRANARPDDRLREAIQNLAAEATLDCFVALLLAMTAVRSKPQRSVLPATARILPGDARQIANADSALTAIAMAKATV
jgi:hypothetical protein